IIRTASWRGASRVIAVGMNDGPRLQTALALGATDIIDLASCGSLKDGLQALMGSATVDVVFEATGHAASIPDGLSILRKGGVPAAARAGRGRAAPRARAAPGRPVPPAPPPTPRPRPGGAGGCAASATTPARPGGTRRRPSAPPARGRVRAQGARPGTAARC